ncbi:sulfate ABC transporter substrate-binding protein [Raineyella fluvialis]|uniref:Sulfate ABC transporter substrate-binding protein n=2 Tax=Raineyella fluvialis TaxID=2662261 RepID=A0A5Q2FEB8_9ACTN|nr:sulfate ABC transporter substrate-binding protein [Raineyella fluvialis]
MSLAMSLLLVVTLAGCAGGSSDTPGAAPAPAGGQVLNLYAFSVAKPAFEALGAAYATTPEGSKVTVLSSYGASGDQSRKVVAGAPADVVSFSITPDVTRVVKAGLVDSSWNAGPTAGTPVNSVVVMVVRKGNPKNIHDWNDLLRPGVDVVTPNPLSSGSAQWNLLAPYAAESNGGKDKQAGLDYVRSLVEDHVTTRPSSGSDATETFRQGHGDVLLSYENEAIAAIRKGDDVEYVVPPQTIRIECPVAAVSASPNRDAAQRFVDFVATPAGQEALATAGYRPVDPTVAAAHAAQFPTPAKLWTVKDLGGWSSVTAQLFAKDTGAISQIYSRATR